MCSKIVHVKSKIHDHKYMNRVEDRVEDNVLWSNNQTPAQTLFFPKQLQHEIDNETNAKSTLEELEIEQPIFIRRDMSREKL